MPALDIKDTGHLLEDERRRLKDVLIKYYDAIKEKRVPDNTINYEHEIRLTDAIPVNSKPRMLPRTFEINVNKQIDELLRDGVVDVSDSSHASPVVPVIKRDGTIRLCCDFRKLNAKTMPNIFPIPRTENIFENFKDAEIFPVLDLKSAYWHIPIKESDKEKTAFVTTQGKYQWNVLPFGLTDAAFSLARVMVKVLSEFEFAKCFYDDCIIRS